MILPTIASMGPIALSVALASASAAGHPSVAGALCSAIALQEGAAPEWVEVFPPGPQLEARDGRSWTLSDPEGVATASMATGVDLAVDWEHAQARRASKGGEAPAAGWIREMRVRNGRLMARIDWTDRGRASVESREYRYVSADFLHDRSPAREILRVEGIGLVNRPAFVQSALARTEGGSDMEQILAAAIAAALSLAEDATVDQAVDAIKALQAERDTARAAGPALEEFVPRADYDAAVARAEAAESAQADSLEAEIEEALEAAQKAGRITPATRKWHRDQCRTREDLGKFRAYAGLAPLIGSQPGDRSGTPPGGTAAPGNSKAVAAMFGHTPEFVDEHASPLSGAEG